MIFFLLGLSSIKVSEAQIQYMQTTPNVELIVKQYLLLTSSDILNVLVDKECRMALSSEIISI